MKKTHWFFHDWDKIERSNFVRALIATAAGCLLSSFCLSVFYVQQGILSSGLTGLAMLITYNTHWSLSLVTLIINIPLFAIAQRFIGWRAFFLNLFGLIIFTAGIELFAHVPIHFESDWTCLIIGALGYGIGLGIMYRYGGGSGGLDIIGMILNRYLSIPMATTGLVYNTILYLVCSFIQGIDIAAFSIGCMLLCSFANSYVVDGLDRQRCLLIISSKYRELANALMNKVHRGVTILEGRGGYTEEARPVIYCVISPFQVEPTKRLVRSIDPNAFMVISETSGVFGQGKGFHSMDDVETEVGKNSE